MRTQGRGEWGLSRVREVKNYKKQEGVGPYESHLALIPFGSSPPREAVRQGPVFRRWLDEQ